MPQGVRLRCAPPAAASCGPAAANAAHPGPRAKPAPACPSPSTAVAGHARGSAPAARSSGSGRLRQRPQRRLLRRAQRGGESEVRLARRLPAASACRRSARSAKTSAAPDRKCGISGIWPPVEPSTAWFGNTNQFPPLISSIPRRVMLSGPGACDVAARHGADAALDPDRGVDVHDDAEDQHECGDRVHSTAMRTTVMLKAGVKYGRQITKPVTAARPCRPPCTQNSSFCPAL